VCCLGSLKQTPPPLYLSICSGLVLSGHIHPADMYSLWRPCCMPTRTDVQSAGAQASSTDRQRRLDYRWRFSADSAADEDVGFECEDFAQHNQCTILTWCDARSRQQWF